MMSRLVEIYQNHEVHRILDLGCGTGRHIVFLAAHGFQMYGTDASEHALELAKEWLNQVNLSARLEQHRMEDTFPFDDAFFDAVISIQVIHHNLLPNIVITIAEIKRTLREGGMLFLTVPTLPKGPVSPEDDWGLIELEKRTFIPMKGPESGIPHHYFTPKELEKILVGFDILEMFLDDTRHRCVLAMKR